MVCQQTICGVQHTRPFLCENRAKTRSSPSRQFSRRTFVSRLCQFVMQSRCQKKLIEAPQTECIVDFIWNQTRSLTGGRRSLTDETRNLIQLDANFKNWIRNKKRPDALYGRSVSASGLAFYKRGIQSRERDVLFQSLAVAVFEFLAASARTRIITSDFLCFDNCS